jgi:hypothetical protein
MCWILANTSLATFGFNFFGAHIFFIVIFRLSLIRVFLNKVRLQESGLNLNRQEVARLYNPFYHHKIFFQDL